MSVHIIEGRLDGKLENVAIANALPRFLEATRRHASLFCFHYDAVPSLKSLNLSMPYYSVFAADTLLYAVTLTFDL